MKASTLLLSLEALARWREHLALTMGDATTEPRRHREALDFADVPTARRGLH